MLRFRYAFTVKDVTHSRWPSRTRRHVFRTYATKPLHNSPLAPFSSPRELGSWQHRHLSSQLPLSDAQRKTIYALSTPMGKAGVGIVRISGPDALRVWQEMVYSSSTAPEPWRMHKCQFIHPVNRQVLDDGLAVFFRGPKSFTTEDVLELHIHSGRAIISSVLEALASLPTLRPAEPGEFTKRAFKGGRLDLTQVEGLKDMIDAETETQRRMALHAAMGANRAHFEELRSEIINCLALVEALIDFGEGEDIEEGVFQQARSRASDLRSLIQAHLSDNRKGEILRSGIRLAIFGPPNAGKSSLLNFLARRDAAIVTPVPGTTRDILELSLDIGGIPVIVADTAGLRKTCDLVEGIGIERAKKVVETADISLCVLSLTDMNIKLAPGTPIESYIPPDILPLVDEQRTLFLFNKSDLAHSGSRPLPVPDIKKQQQSWTVSLTKGEGCQEFLDGFTLYLQSKYNIWDSDQAESAHAVPLITHARHRVHLESALEFLDAFLTTRPEDVVLGAEELRYAAQAVGKISGVIDEEDVLDVVFRKFCIGK